MRRSIDTALPVRFYDDRNKIKDHAFLSTILFEDDMVCLCTVVPRNTLEEMRYILFSKHDGSVMTTDLMFWYAENYLFSDTDRNARQQEQQRLLDQEDF